MDNYIALENVSLKIKKKTILNNLTLRFSPGDLVLIQGPSGEGKTTMLEVLSGLRKPDSGRVTWSGRSLGQDIPHADLDKERCRLIGLVFWSYRLSAHLSGWDNIFLPAKLSGIKVDENKIIRMAKFFFRHDIESDADATSIEDLLSKKVKLMSGGQQERIATIRAFVLSPRFILADELLRSVDPGLRKEIWDYIKEKHRQMNLCTVVISHNNDFIVDNDFTAKYFFQNGMLQRVSKKRGVHETA